MKQRRAYAGSYSTRVPSQQLPPTCKVASYFLTTRPFASLVTREELIDSPFVSYVHPDDVAGHQKGLSEFSAGTQDSSTREIRLRHADGHFVPCEVHTVAMRDDSGSFVGVIGQLVDLTEQKRAEEERARATRLAHLLFEQSPIPTGMVDLKGRLQLVNDAFAEVLGSTSDKLVGKLTPRSCTRKKPRISVVSSPNCSREPGSYSQWSGICATRTVISFPVRLYVTAIRDVSGSVVGILGQFLDRSDLRAWRNSSSTKNSTTR